MALQHKGITHPIAHSVHMMDLLLKGMSYWIYVWKICEDFAVFFVKGAAEQKTNIINLATGPYEKIQLQGKSVSEIKH